MAKHCLVSRPEQLSSAWLERNAFTSCATQILNDAVARAIARFLIGPVPEAVVLWAMLKWELTLGRELVERIIGHRSGLERALDLLLNAHQFDARRGIPEDFVIDLTPFGAMAQRATECARILGDRYVGSEHLLLALCESQSTELRKILKQYQITYDLVMHQLQFVRDEAEKSDNDE